MISETLELRVEGGRLRHNGCMFVVSHGYGGFGGGRFADDGWYACGIKPGWSHVDRCRSTSRVRFDTLMTPDHNAVVYGTQRF